MRWSNVADGLCAIGQPLLKGCVLWTQSRRDRRRHLLCVKFQRNGAPLDASSLPAEPLGGEGGGVDRLMYAFEVSHPLLQEGET